MKKLVLIFILIASFVGSLVLWRAGSSAAPPDASLIPLLSSEDTAGYARALVPGAIEFPRDLGPHNDYQTEWWYYTGNLATADGRQFGYQFTIFRRALTPENDQSTISSPQSLSQWRTNQVYLAHFVISDIANNAFYPAERFSRGAAALAGAQAEPYRVWLEDWIIEATAPDRVRLHAKTEEVALDLILTQTVPPALHGDQGLSPKGPEPGNASYYYSIVQQTTAGTVTVQGETFNVTGLSWKDHEYSTSALSPGAIGWDWFSLQLDDGTALMFFQIRREDGTLEPASSGSFIAADGTVTHLDRADWEVEVLDTWTSPTSGAEYPAGWRIHVAQIGLELQGRPLMPNQELNVSTTYWEGTVSFSGTRGGQPVQAKGYIEMTGYAGSMKGRL